MASSLLVYVVFVQNGRLRSEAPGSRHIGDKELEMEVVMRLRRKIPLPASSQMARKKEMGIFKKRRNMMSMDHMPPQMSRKWFKIVSISRGP